jgi:hypothetical protein
MENQQTNKRVSLWNTVYNRRICGNSAPMFSNLAKYLAKHPECEVYCGQDVGSAPTKTRVLAAAPIVILKRVTLWHKASKRKVVGNAAPLEKNLAKYLSKHPEYEVFDVGGEEKEKDIQSAIQRVLGAIVTSVVAINKVANKAEAARKKSEKDMALVKKAANNMGKLSQPGKLSQQLALKKHSAPKPKKMLAKKLHRPRKPGHPGKCNSQLLGDGPEPLGGCPKNPGVCTRPAGHSGHCKTRVAKRKAAAQSAGLALLLACLETEQTQGPSTTVSECNAGFCMLDLLVEATSRAPAAASGLMHVATSPSSKLAPESPPFSPMSGPEVMLDGSAFMLPQLCLGAPSPKHRVATFHRLNE